MNVSEFTHPSSITQLVEEEADVEGEPNHIFKRRKLD